MVVHVHKSIMSMFKHETETHDKSMIVFTYVNMTSITDDTAVV